MCLTFLFPWRLFGLAMALLPLLPGQEILPETCRRKILIVVNKICKGQDLVEFI